MFVRIALLTLASFALSPQQISARDVNGSAEIIDGDTLVVAGMKVRLFGVDAPETNQSCFKGNETWQCGVAAAQALRSLIGNADVRCSGQEIDIYGRLIASCSIGQADIARELVAAGWATAFRQYSEQYVAEETHAKASRLGIWSSTFDLPEDFRRVERGELAQTTTGTTRAPPKPNRQKVWSRDGLCLIKGNRNRRGQWIYHLPGMPYYDQTRAEDIFCTEAQAQTAGYRRAIVR